MGMNVPVASLSRLRTASVARWMRRVMIDMTFISLLLGGLASQWVDRPAQARVAWYYECYGWEYWSDCDWDGVVNGEDSCPNEPGSAACNGCPDWQCDSDGDGINNMMDSCPNEPGSAACNGCPDWQCNPCSDPATSMCNPACPGYDPCMCDPLQCDPDGDGIPSMYDNCPSEAGVSLCYGCPQWYCDSDLDGIRNENDSCPNEPGGAATNGCPDRDGDGVRDSWDACPDQPGISSCNGCPQYCGTCGFQDCNQNGVADSCDLQTSVFGPSMLSNGDFESSVFNGCPNLCQTSCGFTLPGWSHGNLTEDLILNVDGCAAPNPYGGDFILSLQGSVCCGCDNNGSIRQDVTLVPGDTYRISLEVFIDAYDAIKMEIDGKEWVVSPENAPIYAWHRVEYTFTASSRDANLRLSSIGTKDAPGCLEATYANIDNVSLQRLVPVAVDRNNNGRPDSCDIADGWEEDCDNDGVVDSVEGGNGLWYQMASGQVGPIGYTSPRTIELAAPPYALGYVNLYIEAFGDFSSSSEYLKIYLNGRWVGEVFNYPGNDCQWAQGHAMAIPRDFYNEAIKGAVGTNATFEVVSSIAVNANQCPTGSWVRLTLSYDASVTEDCNANGLLDVCEMLLVPDSDGNGNGIIDACEDYRLVFECAGDLDGTGTVDTGDIGLLLMNFGLSMPGDPFDLDADGMIDNADIAMVLLGFGDCN